MEWSMNSAIRRAYEQGRWKNAFIETTVLSLLLALVLVLLGGSALQGLVALLLGGSFLLFRWRGQLYGAGALLGVSAGLVPLLTPLALICVGTGCTGPSCPPGCALLCALGGLVGGLVVGWKAQNLKVMLVGLGVALLAGMVGCWPMSVSTLTGVGLGLLFGAPFAWLLRVFYIRA
jgi:hypothetical protein